MDGEGLRLIVPRKLRDGRLPHDRFTVVWSGPSDGKTCDACDVLLTEQHVLMERTRGRKTPPAYFHVHRFWGLGSRTARRLMDAEPSAISSGKSSTMRLPRGSLRFPERLPRRPLRRVPRRALPAGAGQ